MEVVREYVVDALRIGMTYPYNVAFGVFAVGITLIALKRYFGGGVCYSKATLNGKTVVITGANTGIGLETAVDVAKRGARVIFACRSADKGEAAAKDVKQRSGNQSVMFAKLDLASLQSVREFSAKILEEEPHIDILINNAGVMIPPYTKTKDDFELQFGVNHLAHFLLTNLLLHRLKEAPSARIINVSSLAHYRGKINFDDLQSERSYSKFGAYSQSKLANVLFTRSLAQRLKNTSVTTYSLHPGVVNTDLLRHINVIFMLVALPIRWFLFKTPWQGAQTTIYCAISEGIEGYSGCYFADCRPAKKLRNPQATDDGIADRLWKVSTQLVGLEAKDDKI